VLWAKKPKVIPAAINDRRTPRVPTDRQAHPRDRDKLLVDAKAAEEAGAFAILLECVPGEIAKEVTAALSVPTIGIGAGAGCDGQILVIHDVLRLGTGRVPSHAKAYADLGTAITQAVTQYRDEVRKGTFPGVEQTFE